MLQKLHKNAKTNYSIRKEIKESDLSVSALAEKFNISWLTAIDRVSKVGFLWISTRKTKEMGASFLRKVLRFYPYAIHYILTDNGFEFSYKALPKGKKIKKVHPFDLKPLQF